MTPSYSTETATALVERAKIPAFVLEVDLEMRQTTFILTIRTKHAGIFRIPFSGLHEAGYNRTTLDTLMSNIAYS